MISIQQKIINSPSVPLLLSIPRSSLHSHLTKLESLRKVCQIIDCCSAQQRDYLWKKFLSQISPSNITHSQGTFSNFFGIMLEAWNKDHQRYSQYIEILWNVIHQSINDRPEIFQSDLPKLSDFIPKNYKNVIFIPSPVSISNNGSGSLPECAVDSYLPPQPSPFGFDYLSHLSQLRFLEFWGPTLDGLAPAYKTSLWQTSKIFREFGQNHDITSFRKTISQWSQSPLENLESIHLLFCAIGYLKNAGVLKHEFFYPTTGDLLFPVFRSDVDTKQTKRRRRKRQRQPEPCKEYPVKIEFIPPTHERPLNATKLVQSSTSAFKNVQFCKKKKPNTKENTLATMPTRAEPDNQISDFVSSLEVPSAKRTKLDTNATTKVIQQPRRTPIQPYCVPTRACKQDISYLEEDDDDDEEEEEIHMKQRQRRHSAPPALYGLINEEDEELYDDDEDEDEDVDSEEDFDEDLRYAGVHDNIMF